MLKIGILQLGYETNTFALGTASLEDMGPRVSAGEVLDAFRGGRSSVSGAIDAIEALGAQPVPLDLVSRGGAFNAGPILKAGTLKTAMDALCAQLVSTPIDGLFFAMHGATCEKNCWDGDSYCLQRLRECLGTIPIMCSMDLHGNITHQMLALCDGIFGIKELPHTDFYEAGHLAATCLIRTLQGKLRPRMALQKLPMLINSASGNTLEGTGKKVRDYFSDYVQSKGLLDATFFHGFSAMDSPDTGVSVLTVTDGTDPTPHAQALSQWVWQQRSQFNTPVYTAKKAVDLALSAIRDGYVVINEGADNPGGGSPGDGTHLLRELVRRDLDRVIMGPLFDPETAQLCHRHKIGDRFPVRLGGKTDPVFGAPLEMEAQLLWLGDGTFTCATPMYKNMVMCYGPSARVRLGNTECIVVSKRFQTYDDRPFLMAGCRMADYRIVALKSMNHFRAYFAPIADAIITADTPSQFPADLAALKFQHIKRPIYPLDEF